MAVASPPHRGRTMRDIKVIILGYNTSVSYQLPADDKCVVASSDGEYRAADIYLIEVDWKGDETLLFTSGKVIEFASASAGMELLEVIKSGEHRFKAPTQSGEGENEDD